MVTEWKAQQALLRVGSSFVIPLGVRDRQLVQRESTIEGSRKRQGSVCGSAAKTHYDKTDPFTQRLTLALRRHGYQVDEGVGPSHFPVDLAVWKPGI